MNHIALIDKSIDDWRDIFPLVKGIQFNSITSLNLHSNNLNSFDIVALQSLSNLLMLDMSSNLIRSLEGIGSFLRLEYLNLSFNQVRSLDGLMELHSPFHPLNTLDLKGNLIDDLKQLKYLSGCPDLRTLILTASTGIYPTRQNPICLTNADLSKIIFSTQIVCLDGHDRYNDPVDIFNHLLGQDIVSLDESDAPKGDSNEALIIRKIGHMQKTLEQLPRRSGEEMPVTLLTKFVNDLKVQEATISQESKTNREDSNRLKMIECHMEEILKYFRDYQPSTVEVKTIQCQTNDEGEKKKKMKAEKKRRDLEEQRSKALVEEKVEEIRQLKASLKALEVDHEIALNQRDLEESDLKRSIEEDQRELEKVHQRDLEKVHQRDLENHKRDLENYKRDLENHKRELKRDLEEVHKRDLEVHKSALEEANHQREKDILKRDFNHQREIDVLKRDFNQQREKVKEANQQGEKVVEENHQREKEKDQKVKSFLKRAQTAYQEIEAEYVKSAQKFKTQTKKFEATQIDLINAVKQLKVELENTEQENINCRELAEKLKAKIGIMACNIADLEGAKIKLKTELKCLKSHVCPSPSPSKVEKLEYEIGILTALVSQNESKMKIKDCNIEDLTSSIRSLKTNLENKVFTILTQNMAFLNVSGKVNSIEDENIDLTTKVSALKADIDLLEANENYYRCIAAEYLDERDKLKLKINLVSNKLMERNLGVEKVEKEVLLVRANQVANEERHQADLMKLKSEMDTSRIESKNLEESLRTANSQHLACSKEKDDLGKELKFILKEMASEKKKANSRIAKLRDMLD